MNRKQIDDHNKGESKRLRMHYLSFVLLAVYIWVSLMAYAVRHPEATEIQRFYAFFDAMMWR